MSLRIKKDITATNIGCEDYHDCGSCRYYYPCAREELHIEDIEITKDNIDELKNTFKITNIQKIKIKEHLK